MVSEIIGNKIFFQANVKYLNIFVEDRQEFLSYVLVLPPFKQSQSVSICRNLKKKNTLTFNTTPD